MKLNVLLVSDQVRGIDGTGGLGDVATGLARELAERDDTDIRVLMPGYEQISERGHEKLVTQAVADTLEGRLSGGRMVPALTIGAQALRGFSQQDWSSYLDAAGRIASVFSTRTVCRGSTGNWSWRSSRSSGCSSVWAPLGGRAPEIRYFRCA